MQETWIWSLGWEDPLVEKMTTTAVYLPGEPYGRGAWQARVHGITKTVGHNLETKNNDKTKHLLPQKLSTILPYCHQDLSMFIQTFQSFRSMRWNSRVCCCFELSYVPGSISLSGREKGAEVHVHFQICITQRISFWIFLTCFSRVMMLHIPHSVILIPKLTCFIMSQESSFLMKSSLCSCWTVMTLGWLSFLGMIWWSNSHSGDGGFRLGGLDMCVVCYSSRR